jgi:uncharacterized membrane protein YdbT with pleckstrin-like domain
MLDAVKRSMLRLLKVPPEPQLPSGSSGTARVFRASNRYLRLKLLHWGWKQIGTLVGLVAAIVGLNVMAAGGLESLGDIPHRDLVLHFVGWAELIGAVFFVVQLPLSVVPVILDWEMRWYIVTDRSLRIREGVWKVNELTMTFANVQEVSIRQGPLERMFGISNLRVRTAGGGQSPAKQGESEEKSGHIGYFRGVDDAPAIRDLILERLKRLRDAGLGDPDAVADEEVDPMMVAPSSLLDAAREMVEEAKALRRAVQG